MGLRERTGVSVTMVIPQQQVWLHDATNVLLQPQEDGTVVLSIPGFVAGAEAPEYVRIEVTLTQDDARDLRQALVSAEVTAEMAGRR